MKQKHIFTSESVGEGHPDKVADYISDSILDACLEQDPESRVACETLVKSDHVALAGEITTRAEIDYDCLVREAIREIGYCTEKDDACFNADSVKITNWLTAQSPDIAQGVDAAPAKGKVGAEQGAGDQGIMFGYACNETPELMPAPIMFAHRITRRLAQARKAGEVGWLRPDCKSQVAVEYANGKPVRIVNAVVATQHAEEASHGEISAFCTQLVREVLPAELITDETEFFVNPTGRFVIGGPQGDSGLTGRKIIVDTYGGMGRHGGGAFSGKDCSKVDRSGAYMCRWVAKHIVAAGLADRCEMQVAYAIGKADPVGIYLDVDCGGTERVSEQEIIARVLRTFSFKPADMVKQLSLKRPIFRASTNYGHFTKSSLPWETVDPEKINALKQA